MTTTPDAVPDAVCDAALERVAVGEPLGELAEHVTGCARCQRGLALAGKLGATHREIDPGLGFAARMTVGAQHRLAVRRRRRIAAGLAATVAAGVIGVVVLTRTSESPRSTVATDTRPAPAPEPAIDPATDADVKALVHLADVDRSSRLSARWRRITKPLATYRSLVQGVQP